MHLQLRKPLFAVVHRCQGNLYQKHAAVISTEPKLDNAAVASAAVEEPIQEPLPMSKIKGFKDYPFLGTLPSILFNKKFRTDRIHEFWRSAFDDYGPVVRLRYPWSPRNVILIYRPEDIHATFKATMRNPIRYGFSSLRHVRKNAEGNYFGDNTGLLPENNEQWKSMRSKVQGPSLRIPKLYKYLPPIDEVVLDFLDRIKELQEANGGETPSNFIEELYKWAIESVSLVTLNRRLGCLDKDADPNSFPFQMIETITQMFEGLAETEVNVKFWKYFPTPVIRKLQKTHDTFVRLLLAALEESNQMDSSKGAVSEPFIDVLRSIPGMSEKDIVTFILDLYSGGVDTTSHSLAFSLYLLARNPKVQKKLHDEVDQLLGDGKAPFTEWHHQNFYYLKHVVKESLRIFPVVVGTPRILEEDLVLSGYLIPKGNAIYCVNMVTSRHEEVFPRASEFIPERWGKDKPLGKIHPYASIPFAHGPRMCIGRRIAENELFVFLARAMHRYTVKYNHEDIEIQTRLVGLPSKPLRFQFIERR